MKTTIVLLVAIIVSGYSVKLPPDFAKCDRSDPGARKCFVEAARKTIIQLNKNYPQVHFPSVDPLEISELTISAGAQVVNVDQHYKNCKLHGITETKIEDYGFNFDEKYIYGSGIIPQLRKVCEYEVDGKILVIPVAGRGLSTVILKNVNVALRLDYEEVKKKGATYMNFTKQNLSLDPETISYNFENLFDGNRALGDNINKVLNENPLEVFNDVKKGYEDAIGTILMQILHNLFAKVSMEEAFD